GAQCNASVENVGVVAALLGFFTPQKDVCMGVDEAGEDRGLGEVDNSGAGRNRGVGGGDLFDLAAADEDELIGLRSAADGVNESARAEYRKLLGLRVLSCAALWTSRKCQRKARQPSDRSQRPIAHAHPPARWAAEG